MNQSFNFTGARSSAIRVPRRIEDGLPQGAVLDFASEPSPESPARSAAIRSFDERERRTSYPIRLAEAAAALAPGAPGLALAVG
jgi:hypothetical protein